MDFEFSTAVQKIKDFLEMYGLPYEETPYRPDVTVRDFAGLADAIT